MLQPKTYQSRGEHAKYLISNAISPTNQTIQLTRRDSIYMFVDVNNHVDLLFLTTLIVV
jgi:hypothetical protein